MLRLHLNIKSESKHISSTLAQGLRGTASLEEILEASSHMVCSGRIPVDDHMLSATQRRSTSSTFIWGIAQFCYLRPNDLDASIEKQNAITEKPGCEQMRKSVRGVWESGKWIHGLHTLRMRILGIAKLVRINYKTVTLFVNHNFALQIKIIRLFPSRLGAPSRSLPQATTTHCSLPRLFL